MTARGNVPGNLGERARPAGVIDEERVVDQVERGIGHVNGQGVSEDGPVAVGSKAHVRLVEVERCQMLRRAEANVATVCEDTQVRV